MEYFYVKFFRKFSRLFTPLFFLTISAPCFSVQPEWILRGQMGLGSQSIKNEKYFSPSTTERGDNHLNVEGKFGGIYQFSSGFRTELMFGYATEAPIVHNEENGYSRRDIYGFIGYTITRGGKVRLIPTLGVTAWELRGHFPEDQFRLQRTGVAPVVGLELNFVHNDWRHFNLGILYGHYDFGENVSLNLGFGFSL